MTPTIEDVLYKHLGYANIKWFEKNNLNDYNAIKAAMTEWASLNRQGWTRVEDGLPGRFVKVLVQFGQQIILIGEVAANGWVVYWSDGLGAEHPERRIEYWMPIPKPI